MVNLNKTNHKNITSKPQRQGECTPSGRTNTAQKKACGQREGGGEVTDLEGCAFILDNDCIEEEIDNDEADEAKDRHPSVWKAARRQRLITQEAAPRQFLQLQRRFVFKPRHPWLIRGHDEELKGA